LEIKTNQYLSNLFEIPISLNLNNNNMNINISVNIDEKKRSIGLLSGGQQKRCELCLKLALSDIIKERKNNKLNFMMFDEPFTSLCEDSMIKFIELLKTKKIPILLIEHNTIAKSNADNIINIEYKDGYSNFIK